MAEYLCIQRQVITRGQAFLGRVLPMKNAWHVEAQKFSYKIGLASGPQWMIHHTEHRKIFSHVLDVRVHVQDWLKTLARQTFFRIWKALVSLIRPDHAPDLSVSQHRGSNMVLGFSWGKGRLWGLPCYCLYKQICSCTDRHKENVPKVTAQPGSLEHSMQANATNLLLPMCCHWLSSGCTTSDHSLSCSVGFRIKEGWVQTTYASPSPHFSNFRVQ